MGFIIDIIIAVIAVSIIVKAYRAGFFKSVLRLARGIVSFLAAYAFSPTVGDYIYKKFVLGWMADGIEKTVMSISRSENGTFNLAKMFDEMPDALKQIIERYGSNESELGRLCSGITEGGEDAVETLSKYIAQPAADMLSGTVAFFGIFVIVFIVLSIVMLLIDGIFKLPVLKGANRLLGLVFGIAEAALFALLISSAAAAAIRGLGSVNPALFGPQVIENSVVMKFFSSVDLFGLLEGVVK